MGFNLDWANCGTEANYMAHRRIGEQPCKKCTIAATRANAERRRKRRREGRWVTKPIPENMHGTRRGCEMHYQRGESACEPCRLAQNEYNKMRYRKMVGA